MILSCGGTDSQFYGGLTDVGGKERSGHFFEWEAIIRSKAAGATSFDMWGRSTKGIAHFKQGFGGRVVEYGGAWDLIINPTVRALSLRGRQAVVWLARRRRGLDTNGDAAPSGD
jgi:lipid II:glycine glycyltransferase (peptidoglycan interpeptide bridge formation enzyme)